MLLTILIFFNWAVASFPSVNKSIFLSLFAYFFFFIHPLKCSFIFLLFAGIMFLINLKPWTYVQCPPLNRITLGQHKSDNRMIQLADIFCVLFSYITGSLLSDYNKRLIQLSVIQLSGGQCIHLLFVNLSPRIVKTVNNKTAAICNLLFKVS